MFLTLIYTPDITEPWNSSGHSAQEVVIKSSSFLPALIVAFLSVTIAYFIPKVFTKKQ
ncbi:hypothetical protein [Virgibacillus ainsalahensis]